MKRIILIAILLCFAPGMHAQRSIISLNGTWDIEESVEGDRPPRKYTHSVEVPGLVNMTRPGFPDVDRFYSREYYSNYWARPMLVKLDIGEDTMKIGYSFQQRNYFWYRRSFDVSFNSEVVILKINKAQFGACVWINGKKAGESFRCFTSQYYDIKPYLRRSGKNEIMVRIGAHPATLPPSVPAGTDFEKRHWTPGIYDNVSIICTRYPYIEHVQVAPDIHNRQIKVQSVIIPGPGTRELTLDYTVHEWKSRLMAGSFSHAVDITNTDRQVVEMNIPIPGAQLWSPDNPFLYTVNVSTGADDITTRFGMREFRFDTPTRRAYLNGKIIFLRGSNITLHRFFDDSLCKGHPWNEQWVRKLFTDLPQKYHWNSFRFCIGPVPDQWFDIADELGLLIQNEYFIWSYRPYWDKNLLKTEIKEWMRDGWNHPSVAWWDINNETHSPLLGEIIREVRELDLSNRAWDNGYNLPVGDDDPVEDHNYKFYAGQFTDPLWNVQKFQDGMAEKTTNSPHPTAHACVLNEYGWLWLKRNGQPTLLTAAIYDSLASGYSNEERQALYAYLLAAETEYFRAHRNYAGVLHFDYLTGDFNGAITGDIFKNPETLEPVKAYDDYLSEIFKPLGVYVNFFPKEVKMNSEADIPVMLVNDGQTHLSGTIEMKLLDNNLREVATSIAPFGIASLGQQTIKINLKLPGIAGNCWLYTTAVQTNGEKTLCRRKMFID